MGLCSLADLKVHLTARLYDFEDCFLRSFLYGFLPRTSSVSQRVTNKNAKKLCTGGPTGSNAALMMITCKLPMLNKLGKYGSMQVKKSIADYAGVYLNDRLINVRKAFLISQRH
jgi:hypothetical protein